jgi:hypothetical protein
MRNLTQCCFVVFFIAGAIQPAMSQRPGTSADVRVVFQPEERQIITDYFDRNAGSLPPGLAKRNGNLPPGLEKQLRRNGQLPPGLQKRMSSFPSDLEVRLPRLPDYCARGIIGSRAVIYNTRSGLILDVMAVFGGR